MTENVIEKLVRDARDLDAEIKTLTEQKTALIDRLKKELQVGESVTVDGVRATLRPGNRKFSVALAMKLLPEDVRMTCVRPMIDEKMVRETVESLGLAEAAMEPADPSKTVFDLAK